MEIDAAEIAADANKVTGNLANVNLLAQRMKTIEQEIVTLEESLKKKKAALYNIETNELPTEMDACGLKKFTLTDGNSIEVDSIISATLPSKRQIAKADEEDQPMMEFRLASGLKFLRENGAESLIKNVLEFELDKGKDNVVPQLIQMADDLGIPHNREEQINHATLNKFIKERIRDGKPVPMDTFSVYSGRCAYIVKAKSKKGEKKI